MFLKINCLPLKSPPCKLGLKTSSFKIVSNIERSYVMRNLVLICVTFVLHIIAKMELANGDRKLKHLFDSSNWNVYDSEVLNLGVGAPGTDLLQNCCAIFQEATVHCMNYEKEKNSSMLFQYGPTSGTFEARSAIAKYFTSMYGSKVNRVRPSRQYAIFPISPETQKVKYPLMKLSIQECAREDLIVTSGATQGLHLIISTLVDFNGFVFVDEVTYMIALDAIKQFSTLTVIPVKLNDDGVDLVDLEHFFKQKQFRSNRKEFWGMYYTIPIYHNPTGILFSESVCKGIIELARKYDVLVCCDDVYNILYYNDSHAPRRLFAYDECTDLCFRGNVISNGSFSKIIGPGVRLGWLEAPSRIRSILESCGIINSGGCLNNYTAGIISSLFELGLAQQHIKLLYESYKERMLATCEILSKELPTSCRMLQPRGGYFIWITLPEDKDTNDFLQFCLMNEKIFFIPGSRFSANNSAKNCLRIAIAFHNKDKLIDGATRLCSTLKKYLNNSS